MCQTTRVFEKSLILFVKSGVVRDAHLNGEAVTEIDADGFEGVADALACANCFVDVWPAFLGFCSVAAHFCGVGYVLVGHPCGFCFCGLQIEHGSG